MEQSNIAVPMAIAPSSNPAARVYTSSQRISSSVFERTKRLNSSSHETLVHSLLTWSNKCDACVKNMSAGHSDGNDNPHSVCSQRRSSNSHSDAPEGVECLTPKCNSSERCFFGLYMLLAAGMRPVPALNCHSDSSVLVS